jgi:hypothetical protein
MSKLTYWLVLVGIGSILFLLISLLPKGNIDILILENADGDQTILTLDDIFTTRGIDFSRMDIGDGSFHNVETEETLSTLTYWFDKYSEDKGSSLVKVYYIDQIIRLSRHTYLDYHRLTFHSVDGARVLVTPHQHADSLVLLTLEKNKGSHTLRLILPHDNFPQRWLKNVVKITVE